MTSVSDPICDLDIEAYIDDQLDTARRIDVEAYLSEQPAIAARVMADLRMRNALRLLRDAPLPHAPDSMNILARKLERGLLFSRLPRLAAAATLLIGVAATGLFVATNDMGQGAVTSTRTEFLEDAVMSHKVAAVRVQLNWLRRPETVDARQLEARTRVDMPEVPSSWSVHDVQIFPAENSLGLNMVVDSDQAGRFSLFVTRLTEPVAAIKPTIARLDGASIVHWTAGQMAYAVTSSAPIDQEVREAALMRAVEVLVN